jgi:hypothetical protein
MNFIGAMRKPSILIVNKYLPLINIEIKQSSSDAEEED